MKPPRIRGGRRALGLFAVFALVPLTLLVILPLQLSTQSLGHEAESRVAETSSVNADAIAQQLASVEGLTSSMAARPELTAPSTMPVTNPQNPVRQVLHEYQQANVSVRSTALLDATGHTVAVDPWNATAIGTDVSYRDYYTGAVAHAGPYISQAYIGAAANKPKLVAIAQALRGKSNNGGPGPLTGMVVTTVDVSIVFQKHVDNFQQTHNVALGLYDQAGQTVAKPGLGKELTVVDNPHLHDAAHGSQWTGTQVEPGRGKVVVSYAAVPGTGWTVSASVNRNTAFAPVNSLRNRVLVIATILGMCMVAVFVLLARSLRAREKAEQSIRTNERRTRLIIETAVQAFVETTRGGIITEWNRHAEEMFGWTRDEIIGKHLRDTIVPQQGEQPFFESLNQIFSDERGAPESARVEGLAIRRNQTAPFQVEITMWKTVADDNKRLNVFLSDISERKALEAASQLVMKRQRRLVEELREADKTKSDFVSTVSHELRTPLTSITGYLEMLRDGYGGELNESQMSMLDVVDRNSRRLLGLIEDMLTLSRVESGAFKVTNIPVDITSLLVGVQQALIPSASDKHLELEVDVASDTGVVSGDPNQLERVVLNLVTNAIKFTPEGGRVGVNAYRSGGTVHLSVTDNGIGIPIEEQHRLFSRFFRASSAQNRAIQGTGLGLTIVKSIVEHHGGTIAVQSALNVGTTVLVELPATAAVVAGPPVPAVS